MIHSKFTSFLFSSTLPLTPLLSLHPFSLCFPIIFLLIFFQLLSLSLHPTSFHFNYSSSFLSSSPPLFSLHLVPTCPLSLPPSLLLSPQIQEDSGDSLPGRAENQRSSQHSGHGAQQETGRHEVWGSRADSPAEPRDQTSGAGDAAREGPCFYLYANENTFLVVKRRHPVS